MLRLFLYGGYMKVKIYNESAFENPKFQTEGSAGVDLYANIEEEMVLESLERVLVPTGIFLEIPQGFEAQIRARSGLAFKRGLTLANGIGTIDSDYRGEIKVMMINLNREKVSIAPGERIAQMVFAKYEPVNFINVNTVEDLTASDRQAGGFGHTGV